MLDLRIGDGTHHKKRHAIRTRGETPIGKNVAVTDEQGNVYESTYPRRAKGLVKHGRARWMDDNRICLTCPPEQIQMTSEDDMNDNQIAYIKEQIEFLKTELERCCDSFTGPQNPEELIIRNWEACNEMRRKILELIDRLADPQRAERREQEKQQYRDILQRISADDKALQAAKEVAFECECDNAEDIINAAVQAHEATKREIAKMIFEKLA